MLNRVRRRPFRTHTNERTLFGTSAFAELCFFVEMWVCVNCSEQNNAVGTSECMVCRAVAPTRSSPRVASRQKKTKTEESGPEKAALVAEVPGAVWRNDGTLLIYGVPATPEAKAAKKKVAAFDLDSTLVVPRSGAKFAQSRADWKWLDTRVPEKLHKLAAAGFELVVFSNQAGVEKKQTTQEEVRGRAENVAAALGVPMRWFLATAGDQYRKPSPVMWELYEALFSDSVVMAESFYCGDAAGRKKNWAAGKPRDFACSDRMFAANVGLPFVTPEELFFGEKPTDQWNWGSPDPRTLVAKYENAVAPKIVARVAADGAVELVVLVGSPASGKSSLAKGIFEKAGFVRANNDDLGSKAKSLKVCAFAVF